MNRELIVKLLKKNIDDLILLTDGFEEMTSYPRALIHLAQLKTNDIKEYLYELSEWKQDEPVVVPAMDNTLDEDEKNTDFLPVATELPDDEPVISVVEEIEEEVELSENNEIEEEEELTVEEEEEDDEVKDEELIPEISENLSFEEESSVAVQEESTAAVQKEIVATVTPEPLVIANQPEETQEPVAIESTEPAIDTAPVYTSDDKKPTLGERLASGITRNEVHSGGEADRLSNTLANKKIEDIRQAISIGDRFRFQRELFRNNGEEMNKMLNYINLLASYQEIETFLQKKYSWSDDNEAARDLYAIVRRKFL